MWGLPDPVASGINVDEVVAQNFSAVYCAVTLIADVMAMLPCPTYRREAENNRTLATGHPASTVANGSPDGDMTRFVARQTSQSHTLLRGNCVSELQRNKRGQGIASYILDPRRIGYEHTAHGERQYVSYENSKEVRLAESDVIHIPALSWDGWIGKSPISLARETVGLALVAERYGATYFGKGGRLPGYLSKDTHVPKTLRDTYRQEWMEMQEGQGNFHQVGFLSGGLKYNQIGVPPDDAQFLQTRQFQIGEVGRWYRTPPHMLGLMDGAKYSNIEAMLIEFLTFTMMPWIVRWEQELNKKLFTRVEQNIYYCEFDYNMLLRADSKTRYEAIERQLRNGQLLIDEARALDNRNAYPDGIGSKPLVMASQLATLKDVIEGKLNTGSPMKENTAKPAQNEGSAGIGNVMLALLTLPSELRAEVMNHIDLCFRGKTPGAVLKELENGV